jgi:ubiquinone/menaquinone biosynthesis C-methylase UbiE
MDPLQAYYELFHLQKAARAPVWVNATTVIQDCMQGARVLDLGCGNGWRLRENSALFTRGVGLDISEYALDMAKREATTAGTTNVEFIRASGASLPFPEGSFDFVYSERGPLGYDDAPLLEAFRVLKPGGRLFFETLGSLNLLEPRETFEGYDTLGETVLTSLDQERQRTERLGFRITLLATNRQEIVFKSLYEWLPWQCSIWRYLEKPQPWIPNMKLLDAFAQAYLAEDGKLPITYHVIWVGGTKPTI